MKNLIKSIIFIFIFCIIWYYVFDILWLPGTNITSFYNEPKNSLDIVYIGGSNVHTSFNHVLAYDLYGFTTGFLSTSSQPFIATKYLIKEAEKSQKPILYIIDIALLANDGLYNFEEEWGREVVDSMKFSKNRIDLINELLKYAEVDKDEYINYYFSFLMYHNSWKNIKVYDDNPYHTIYYANGYYKNYVMWSAQVPQKPFSWSDGIVELSEPNRKILLDLIDYIKTNDLNVLFIVPKRIYYGNALEKMNNIISIIKMNNLDVLNFNTLDEVEIDFDTDFVDSIHYNLYGGTKFTLYLSKYLYEHYNLPNHKGQYLYKSWDLEYEKFKRGLDLQIYPGLNELISSYKYIYGIN